MASIALLFIFAVGGPAFAFDWQVQGQGHSVSVIPGIALHSLKWSQGNSSANLASQVVSGFRVRYTSRDAGLASDFVELQYQRYGEVSMPHPTKISGYPGYTLGIFAGQTSSSLHVFWAGYSIGVTQEYFISKTSIQIIELEKKWVGHARISASVALWSPAFGANAAADRNVAPTDSPKLRLEVMAGPLSPYKASIASKYWGWEGSLRTRYGNSLQWISLQYEIADQFNSQSRHRRDSLGIELSLSLDRQKQREKGSGW